MQAHALEPSARIGHVRWLRDGWPVLVRPSVVRAAAAPARAAAVHRMAYDETADAVAALLEAGAFAHELGLRAEAANDGQQDLFAEDLSESRRDLCAARAALEAGVAGYARLTPAEAERLALARLSLYLQGDKHLALAKVAAASRAVSQPLKDALQASAMELERAGAQLERLEARMLRRSLQRLPAAQARLAAALQLVRLRQREAAVRQTAVAAAGPR